MFVIKIYLVFYITHVRESQQFRPGSYYSQARLGAVACWADKGGSEMSSDQPCKGTGSETKSFINIEY